MLLDIVGACNAHSYDKIKALSTQPPLPRAFAMLYHRVPLFLYY